MELGKLSLAELRSLQDKIKLELKQREHKDLAKAREQIMAIAQKVGIPLNELTSGVRIRTSTVPVRYRNPGDGAQQWTGRGRQPKWVKAWVDAGKSIDLLRV